MTIQKILNDKMFELSVHTLGQLRRDLKDQTGVLAKILKEGMLQSGRYEINVHPAHASYDTLVRVIHPKNIHRASIDMHGNVHVLANGGVQSFPASEFDDALDYMFLQIVQRT